MTESLPTPIGRRAFLLHSTLILTAGQLTVDPVCSLLASEAPKDSPAQNTVTFGMVTDLHYADKPAAGSRYYRETLGKLEEAGKEFEKADPNFIVELGDLIDSADTVETELKYLKTVNKIFSAIGKDRHYVLGNHCVETLRKAEFLETVEQKAAHYSFDRGGIHFVILDACYRSDGQPYGRKNSKWYDANIPQAELEWLQGDLKATDKPVIVFAHQRLDVETQVGVKNAPAVRKVLEGSKKVSAVFQGHSHKNDYKEIGGIHYCTLVAMIEGTGATRNGYSTVQVETNGTIRLTGFREQKGYSWKESR